MNETITLKEAGESLGYKDTRSIEKWCQSNNVMIFFEPGTKRKYLMQLQFRHARLKQFIEYLKEKYKEKWLDAFQRYESMDITKVIELEEMGKMTFSITNNYKPAGNQERRFFNLLSKVDK